MGKTIANFRVDEEEWKEFQEIVPNASENIREYVKQKLRSTDGLEQKLERVKADIKRHKNQIGRLEKKKKKVKQRLESRKKLKEKQKQSIPNNGFDYDTEYITDKWRDQYTKILAVHVKNSQKCEKCGEQIKHGELLYFDEDSGKFYGYDHYRDSGPDKTTPAVLMTDLEVNNN